MGLLVWLQQFCEYDMIADYIPGEISGKSSKGGMRLSIPFTMRKARASQNVFICLQSGWERLPRERSALPLPKCRLSVCA